VAAAEIPARPAGHDEQRAAVGGRGQPPPLIRRAERSWSVTGPQAVKTGVASHLGRYADVVVVPAGYRHFYVSGTPGLRADGTLPEEFAEEARQAWRNVAAALAAAGAELTDIVSVRQWLTSTEDVAAYVAVRAEVISHEPAFMLGIVSGLIWPQIRVEIEVTAVRPAD
jgi:2-iminobutanoate/2-iminopropanoate deaminase